MQLCHLSSLWVHNPQEKVAESLAKERGFGYRLLAICVRDKDGKARHYRSPVEQDYVAIQSACDALSQIKQVRVDGDLSVIPEEELPYLRSIFNVRVYGIDRWEKLFTNRQLLSAAHQVLLFREIAKKITANESDPRTSEAVVTCLALAISNSLQYQCSIATYLSDGIVSAFIQGQSLGMKMDFVEANPLQRDPCRRI